MTHVALAHDEAGHGPAVVLVHGHPFNRSMWRGQLGTLAREFRVVAPDLRGYGDSPATSGTVGMDELAADVWDLLARLGIADVAVVGLSMGGLVAMEMATARPERIWALGLVATTAAPVTEDERRRRLELADAVEAAGTAALVDSMASGLFGPHVDAAVVAEVTRMMEATDPFGAAAALRGRAARPDYRERLRRLRRPSFVCTGTEDAWSTPAVTEELVACLQAPRTLSLPGVAHLPNLECPERFDPELADFLRSARRAGG